MATMKHYRPDQFEFAILCYDQLISVHFNPVEETGLSSDQHIGELTEFLEKEEFICIQECAYSRDGGTVEEVRELLVKMGFIDSKELKDLLLECADYSEADSSAIMEKW